MPAGTEQITTSASPIREKPQLSPAPEPKQNTHGGSEHGGIYSHLREIVAANGAQEPPPAQFSTIFRKAEFSNPVNDQQKGRALGLLQNQYGNRYVQRVLAQNSAETSGHAGLIQRRVNAGDEGSISPSLQIDRSVGHPLDSSTRSSMESHLDHNFNDVRVHTDSSAHEAAKSLSAEAFTTGRDVYFREGAYNPGSDAGRGLLAHELTHVVQQQSGAARPGVSSPADPLERQAEAVGSAIAADKCAPATSAAAVVPSVQRHTHTGGAAALLPSKTSSQNSRFGAASLIGTPPIQRRSRQSPRRMQRRVIQRSNGTPPAGPTPAVTTPSTATPTTGAIPAAGVVDPSTHTITIPEISLPQFKVTRHVDQYGSGATLVRPAGYSRTETTQASVWRNAVQGAVDSLVETRTASAPFVRGDRNRQVYFLKSRAADLYIFGEKTTLKSELTSPFWDKDGRPRRFQVDHRKELQLGGTNTPENLELLEETANSSSGSLIRGQIAQRVRAALTAQKQAAAAAAAPATPATTTTTTPATTSAPPAVIATQEETQAALQAYTVRFQRASSTEYLPITGQPEMCWSVTDITGGRMLAPLEILTETQIESSHLRGQATELVIYNEARGGMPRRIAWPPGSTVQSMNRSNWIPGFNLKEVLFQPGEERQRQGLLTGEAFRGSSVIDMAALSWEVSRIPHVPYGGAIDEASVLRSVANTLRLKGLSPIQISRAFLDESKGLVAIGQVLPTVPLFRNIGIDLVIEGNEVRLRKLFDAGDFQFPGPVRVTQSTLEVFVSSRRGLGVSGQVQFEITRVGRGRIGAGASTGTGGGSERGFAIEGEFEFDTRLFQPARIEAWYRNGEFGLRGRLGIPPNRVRGIRSADIRVAYGSGLLEASGNAELTIPGVQRAALTVRYSEAEGLLIGGTLQLANNIPGIRSGTVEAQVRQRSGGEYDVTARGTAVPNIPGVNTTLTVAFENGALTVEGRAAYSRGMLSGSLRMGATNRPVDAQGNPQANAEPGNQFRAYGGGTVTVRIAPWLQGTIGVRILPNGEIEVSGAIGLPSTLPLFPVKPFNKNIFHIDIDIPIVGVSIIGQRIGIFATIGGGLDVNAGIGPGQLRELGLTITYNPAHEDQTHVTGRAEMFIPAHAGLRLFVRGGLGVGIPIVSATARLVVGASLGLEGAVVASLAVDWMPNRGLILNARGEIFVQPKFKFDVTGEVLVEADLLFSTVELYSHRWNLASFEYGSDLRFGVRFPIHYQEGIPFDISLSDVEFVVPEIDPMDLLTGLIKRI
jgi:uncharacterized protein DUF4157